MHILASVNVHIQKPKCTYTKSLFCICTFWLPYMRIFSFQNAHIRKPKCAYTEEIFRICAFWLPYMHIYESQNVHIRKLSSVYVHFIFRICAFWLSVNAHIQKPKCTYTEALYTEESFHICAYFGFRKCAYTERKMYIYRRELP
jgi:hypothetical protein